MAMMQAQQLKKAVQARLGRKIDTNTYEDVSPHHPAQLIVSDARKILAVWLPTLLLLSQIFCVEPTRRANSCQLHVALQLPWLCEGRTGLQLSYMLLYVFRKVA